MATLLEADRLVKELRSSGFTLRLKDGKLLVAPLSKLSAEQRRAINGVKEEVVALLEWEELEPPATDDTLKAWYGTLEEKERVPTLAPLPRRIVLLSPNGAIERVPAEPPAAKVIEELRRLRGEYPGRALAAEWQNNGKWVRWITTLEAMHEGPIATSGV